MKQAWRGISAGMMGVLCVAHAAEFSQEDALRGASKRKATEVNAAQKWTVFYNFTFTNRFAQSGITFEHVAVEDASKNWIPAHYDHGSGMAAADVDGDGKIDLVFLNQVGGNQLYLNLGGRKFSNITERAGIALAGQVSVAAAFADIDNDGDPDLFITTVRGGNALF